MDKKIMEDEVKKLEKVIRMLTCIDSNKNISPRSFDEIKEHEKSFFVEMVARSYSIRNDLDIKLKTPF